MFSQITGTLSTIKLLCQDVSVSGVFDPSVKVNDYTAYSNISSPNYILPNIDDPDLYNGYRDISGNIKLSLYYAGVDDDNEAWDRTIIWKQTQVPTATRTLALYHSNGAASSLEIIDDGDEGTTLPNFFGMAKTNLGNSFLSGYDLENGW